MKKTLYFEGTKVKEDVLSGSVKIEEIKKLFGASWIPDYQRDRVLDNQKINDLKRAFASDELVGVIMLNLRGKYIFEKVIGDCGVGVLEGEFDVIDGQQRLWALKDSTAVDGKISVLICVNYEKAKAKQSFITYNEKQTKMRFGDSAKNRDGSFAQICRDVIKQKEKYPIPVTKTGNKTHLSVQLYSTLLWLTHKKISSGKVLLYQSGKTYLLNFLGYVFLDTEVKLAEYTTRNILAATVELFGTYDRKSLCYSSSFFKAWYRFVLEFFVLNTGKVEFGKYQERAEKIRTVFLKSSRVQDLVTGVSREQSYELQKELMVFFNHKRQHKLISAAEVELYA